MEASAAHPVAEGLFEWPARSDLQRNLDPQQHAAYVADELRRWVPVLRATGATAN